MNCERLVCPPVARMLHKPLPLHMSKWAKLETLTSNVCLFSSAFFISTGFNFLFDIRKRGRGIMMTALTDTSLSAPMFGQTKQLNTLAAVTVSPAARASRCQQPDFKTFSLPELLASPSPYSPSVWLRFDKVVKCNIFVSVSGNI